MRIAIIGTGPTGIYSFAALCHCAGLKTALPEDAPKAFPLYPASLEVVLFEKGAQVGVGMPYSPETTQKTMLANIASIEIPPLTETYLEWMERQSPDKLRSYGIDPDDVDERDFTPRLMLGEYFHDQITALIAAARAAGMKVTVHEATEVQDVQKREAGFALQSTPAHDDGLFDKVVIATGHVFDEKHDGDTHFFPNPWSGLSDADIPATTVGVMGTSLSSIDAAMAVVSQHGRFTRKGGELRYHLDDAAKGKLKITLMSWTGILPEADFYCEIPYLPLKVMTPEALAQAAKSQAPFDAVYQLFRDEIATADPDWSAEAGLGDLDPEGFKRAYFVDREKHDAFKWAKLNLEEAEANKKAKRTVQWRYAILRMHEQVEELVAGFSEDDRARFDDTLKTVFVDNYAAVPSESIRRLLALRDAGVMDVLALGDDYKMEHHDSGTTITAHGKRYDFAVFIDARGQQAMATEDLPFASLRKDILAAGYETPEISEDYGLLGVDGYEDRVYLAALPYLMQDQPFVQGITACAEIGQIIAKAEVAAASRHRRRRRRI